MRQHKNERIFKRARRCIKKARRVSKIILQSVVRNVRYNMTCTRQKEDYRSFYLKKTTWDAIRISRGWTGKGAASRFSEAIGITRQYGSEIINQRCGCSSNVMRKIIDLLGIKDGCWCHLFDKNCMVDHDPNHPIYNEQKYMGEIPYSKYSPSADSRKKEYSVEKLDE